METAKLTKIDSLRKLLREQVKLAGSQSALARQMNIKVGTLNKHLRGDSFPSLSTLELIASYMGISVSELLKKIEGREESFDPPSAKQILDSAMRLSKEERLKIVKGLLD